MDVAAGILTPPAPKDLPRRTANISSARGESSRQARHRHQQSSISQNLMTAPSLMRSAHDNDYFATVTDLQDHRMKERSSLRRNQCFIFLGVELDSSQNQRQSRKSCISSAVIRSRQHPYFARPHGTLGAATLCQGRVCDSGATASLDALRPVAHWYITSRYR